jgi:hypothetical protein
MSRLKKSKWSKVLKVSDCGTDRSLQTDTAAASLETTTTPYMSNSV